MIGIYKITNPVGKIYIGSSANISKRFVSYKSLMCKSQTKLYNSFLKYGVEAHKFEVVKECLKHELYKYERQFGDLYNVLDRDLGLNCNLPKTNDVQTFASEETRIKHRLNKLGFKHNDEAKRKIVNALKNRVVTDKTKQKMSESACKRTHNYIPVNKAIIVNLQNGVFYEGVENAAFSVNKKRSTLMAMLTNQNKNTTYLVKV